METENQINNRPWLYKKGQSGNPAGRPKGSKTLKTYIRERFESMTNEEREEFLDGLDKKTLWEMGEGKPDTKTDLNLGGQIVVQVVSFKDENNDSSQLPQTD